MLIRFTRGTIWNGLDYAPGEVADVNKFDAEWLVSRQKAKIITEQIDRSVALKTSTAAPLVGRKSFKKRGGLGK